MRALGATRGRLSQATSRAPLVVQRKSAAARCRSHGVRVVCQSVRFPASLPLLPFTPKEVLPPGSCKVLRLHESSSYLLLLEELLSSPHQMLIHSVVQPVGEGGRGHGGGGSGRPGAFEAGGFEFSLSTIVKVIDVKQTERGVLLRVQSEGRVAVKSLAQTRPYFRAVAVPLTDTVDLARLQAPVWRDICGSAERLRGLMRDVQNLAMKFKCPETANLQRAMHWVDNPHPLVFASSSLLLNSRTADGVGVRGAAAAPGLPGAAATAAAATGGSGGGSPLSSYDDEFQPSKVFARLILPDPVEPSYTDAESISSGSDSESDTQYAAAAAAGGGEAPSGASQLHGGAAGRGLAAAAVLAGGGGGVLGGVVIRNRPSLLDLERACRLSLAAIQVLPRATEEEREAIRRHQEAALETQDVLERLTMAQRVMTEARGLLAAKCALLALSSA